MTRREFILHYFALALKAIYDQMVRVPKFLLMVGTGLLGSLVMRLMHRTPLAPAGASEKKPEERKPTPKPRIVKEGEKGKEGVPTPPATPKKTPSKRKGGKK